MIQLYDLNKTKLHGLKNYKDLKVERDLSGDEILSFLYPNLDSKYDSLKEECYIRTKKNEYVVKEINIQDDWTEFVAKINIEDIKGRAVSSFETIEQTCSNAVNLALVGTGWTIGSCDVTKKRTVRKANCSSFDILQEIRKVYLCNLKFDAINKKIYIYQSMGSDKGVYFSDSLNLRKLDIQSNSYDFITRLIPIGKDGLKITAINGGKEYIENYQYSNKVITAYWEDNRYAVVESLKEDAIAKLNELSKPFKSYSADIIDLASLSDKYKNILDYDLGDTITLISKDKKVKEKQRIVKLVEYPDEPEKNTCEIANKTLRFGDIQADNQDVIDVADSVITSDGMIDNSKVNFDPIRLEVTTLIAEKANIGELNAAVARIGTLEATKANITELNAVNANLTNLIAGKADITDLTATNIKFNVGSGGTLDLQTLLSKFVTGENGQFLNLTTDNVTISNAVIKDIIAKNISVEDLKAGTINTNNINLFSEDGGLSIVGPTMQFKDKNNKVRLQLGQDTEGDFNFILRAADGTTTLIDGYGIKEKAIADKLIKSNMVADKAIGEQQINYSSLITGLNKDTNTSLIKASKVALDLTGQTLEVSFNSLKSVADDTKSKTESNTTSINAINGQIATLIIDTTIEEDGATVKLKDSYSNLKQTVSGINATIASHITSISNLTNNLNAVSGKVTTVENKQATLEQNLEGFKTTVSNTYSTKTELNNLSGTVSSINSRVSTAESSINQLNNKIALKVEQTDITKAINSLEIGGRNFITNSGNFKDTRDWTLNGGSNLQVVNKDGFNCLSATGSVKHTDIPLENGTEYTYSCEIMFNADMSITSFVPLHYWINTVGVSGTGGVDGVVTLEGGNRTVPANTWHKIVLKFKTKNDGNDYVLRPFIYKSPFTETWWLKNIKLEKGNKATDWTPAPEDVTSYTDTAISTAKAEIKVTTDSITSSVSSVQSSVNSLGTRMSTAESSITSLNNSISLKVSTTDFNSYKTTNDSAVNSKASQTALNTTNSNLTALTTRVSSAEASISILNNEITSKVSETSLQETISRIEVGSRNYLENTDFMANKGVWISTNSATATNPVFTFGNAELSISGTNTDWKQWQQFSNASGSRPATALQNIQWANTYTLSLELLVESNTSGTFSGNLRANLSDGSTTNYINLSVNTSTVQTNRWIKYEATGNTPNSLTNFSYWRVVLNASVIGKVRIRNVKLEKGNKATDWSPAPEDIQNDLNVATSRISSAESTITQLSNSISLKVDTNTYNTKMNSLDSSISSLNTRMSSAELKITDSAIVSTVRSSSAYTSDLNAKANQNDLNTTNTNVSNLTQTANNIIASFNNISSSNMVRNSDFSTGDSTHYSLTSGAAFSIVNTGGNTSGRAFRFNYSSATPTGYFLVQQIPTNNSLKGKKLIFSVYGWGSNVVAGTSAYVRVDYLDSTGATKYAYFFAFQNRTGSWSWQRFSTLIDLATIADLVTLVEFRVTFSIASGFTGNSQICQLQLEEGDRVTGWRAHQEELYAGYTKIDKDGVTISNGALRVTNSNGDATIDASKLMLRILSYGNGSIVIPNGSQTASATITHNLGYSPAFKGQFRYINNSGGIETYSDSLNLYDWSTGALLYNGRMYADDNRLYIQVWRASNLASSGTKTFYYRYFIEEGVNL